MVPEMIQVFVFSVAQAVVALALALVLAAAVTSALDVAVAPRCGQVTDWQTRVGGHGHWSHDVIAQVGGGGGGGMVQYTLPVPPGNVQFAAFATVAVETLAYW